MVAALPGSQGIDAEAGQLRDGADGITDGRWVAHKSSLPRRLSDVEVFVVDNNLTILRRRIK
jgi:hypothetical protein